MSKEGLKTTGLEDGWTPPDADECAICLEDIAVEGSLDACDHRFCHCCILTWAETENRCPCWCVHRPTIIGDATRRPA